MEKGRYGLIRYPENFGCILRGNPAAGGALQGHRGAFSLLFRPIHFLFHTNHER